VAKKEIAVFWNKQNQLLPGPVIVLTVFLSTPLWAGDIIRYEYAKVLDVTPVIEVVQVPRDERICQQEMVRRRVPEHRSPAPAIFGSILGGVIGSQFGGGSGKTAATIAGASIGGAVATHAQYRRYPLRYYDATQQVCRMERSWGSEERVVAWDVSWKYRGEVYQSRMHEPPGDRIPVRVSVSPVYD
jgi:uncharacterized protein YcfJ